MRPHQNVVQEVIDEALSFFSSYLQVKVIETEVEFDIVDAECGLELGSYGVRQIGDFLWTYGTGIALPRFSVVCKRYYDKKLGRTGG